MVISVLKWNNCNYTIATFVIIVLQFISVTFFLQCYVMKAFLFASLLSCCLPHKSLFSYAGMDLHHAIISRALSTRYLFATKMGYISHNPDRLFYGYFLISPVRLPFPPPHKIRISLLECREGFLPVILLSPARCVIMTLRFTMRFQTKANRF